MGKIMHSCLIFEIIPFSSGSFSPAVLLSSSLQLLNKQSESTYKCNIYDRVYICMCIYLFMLNLKIIFINSKPLKMCILNYKLIIMKFFSHSIN